MDDYIRKAVELADYFDHDEDCDCFDLFVDGSIEYSSGSAKHEVPQFFLDALAAQLRKQAQSDPHIVFNISVVDSASFVEMIIYNPNGNEEAKPLRFVANETDEAMAFLKTIVNSDVLSVSTGLSDEN